MQFRIANTFANSLAKLTGNEQKAAKTTAFDLQLNPARPGLQFHKLQNAQDPHFWSVRASRDVRIIVHRIGNSLMLCYVDHHDSAYQWAEGRKVETHPKTGAAQLVEVRKTVREITVPSYAATDQDLSPKPLLFSGISENDLLSYGVPAEWLDDVRNANEDNFLELTDHLPSEAGEALLELAYGGRSQFVQPAAASPFGSAESRRVAESTAQYGVAADPFDHPDAQRRFRLMTNVEELERALDYPWEKWAVFLHPAQRQIVEKNYGGPFRVAGAAGTGKTIVAIHRAVFLARTNPDARVLLTTFSDTLADVLRTKLRRLIYNEPRLAERLEVEAIDRVGERFFRAQVGAPKIATQEQVQEFLAKSAGQAETHNFSPRLLLSEWENVVDAWQLDHWEAYRDLKRLGRKTRLPVEQRSTLWSIFERVKAELRDRGLVTRADMFSLLAEKLKDRRNPPFDFAIVDEEQDISVAQLRFLAALGAHRPNSLFFAGDLGQRIFQMPFSWKALGVDVRERSQTLKLNYRTSHQIRRQADRLLGPEVADVDGNVEDRRGTISAFNGEPPAIYLFETEQEEGAAVATWLRERGDQGVGPREMAIFVRSGKELDRARRAVRDAGFSFQVLDERVEKSSDCVSISTMHLAKGLEFRAVAVMACDDEVIPLQERIETVADAECVNKFETAEFPKLSYFLCLCRRIDPHLVRRSGDLPGSVDETLRVLVVSAIQSLLTSLENRAGLTVMDHRRSEPAQARMVVDMVVPVEKAPTEGLGVLDGTESFGEVGAVFQGFELGFRERVVVGHLRPGVGLSHTQVRQQQCHRLRLHRRAAVSVENQLTAIDPLPVKAFTNQLFSQSR